MTGSITVSCLPEPLHTNSESEGDTGAGQTFQFCVRDTPTGFYFIHLHFPYHCGVNEYLNAARQDLQEASESMRSMLQGMRNDESNVNIDQPLAVLMFGSMERGNKVFRYQVFSSSPSIIFLSNSFLEI